MHRSMLAMVFVVASAACSHGGFEVTQTRTIPTQTIPGDASAHQLAVSSGLPPVHTETTLMQDAQATPGVTWVALSSVDFVIQAPADGTLAPCWDFVRSVTLSVESTKQGTALPRRVIATASEPACTTHLALTPARDVDLGPYANEGFQLIFDVAAIPPAQNVTFEGTYQLTLSVM